jgi:hypothetical protein
MAEADAILGIAEAYKCCEDPRKVNVCVGAYRDERGMPWVLPSVRAAERLLLEDGDVKEYLPITGDPDFVEGAMKFAYGEDMPMDHLAAVQTVRVDTSYEIDASLLVSETTLAAALVEAFGLGPFSLPSNKPCKERRAPSDFGVTVRWSFLPNFSFENRWRIGDAYRTMAIFCEVSYEPSSKLREAG